MSQLPEGWAGCKLKTAVDKIVGGGTPSKSIPSYFGGTIPWMTVKDMNKLFLTDTIDHITDDAVKNSSTNVIPAGTPIIATRMSLGKIVRASFDSAINQDLKALFVNKHINQYYFEHWYRSQSIKIESLGTGTTVKGIRLEVLHELDFPLAPLAEQTRIVTKLDEVLAQVDTIKARLDGIPAILKRFRQSVLAAAVSGKLTEEWRGSPSTSFNQPPITIGNESNDAPKTWTWTKLLDLAKLESGHTPRKSKLEYWDAGDVYWICLQDIRAAHGKIIEDTKFKPTMKGIENSSARLLPKGTVCFSRDISVGYTTIMGKEMSTTQHFANWICGEQLFNKYLMFALMAAKRHLTDNGQGTTVKTIYMPALKEFYLLTPPIDEQKEIVRLVDQYFAFADTIEAQMKKAQMRVDKLTQAILAKAFRGELTADWRAANPDLISGDNSGAALLARIMAERATASGKKGKHGTSKARAMA
ncbi:restriction endonuclease subunit S [Aeromonas caviae]|uniref:restriction endonuclease subunit S n=1 Tax=Aeromonas caviae TaxID=648 RepID=UPI002B471F71|nr:restriction endonuclease subunit S [Aeromonas caviae]